MAVEVLTSIIIEISKSLLDPIKRHATYLVCYGQNVDTLGSKLNELEQRRNEVQLDVDTASRRGQEVRSEVQQWLTNVDAIKSEATRTVDRLASTKCCRGWCWDPIPCYRLGKEAAKKITTVDELRGKGNFPSVSRPPPTSSITSLLPSGDFQEFSSTKSYMTQVLNALQADGHIIGVQGMGGVGKTTLMKEVAKQVEREKLFNEIVMVTVSQNVMIEKIQKELKEKLSLEFNEENKEVVAAKLSERLKKVRKLLVILDDLWDRLDLGEVGIPYGDKHNGCKIVITTRRSHVCKVMNSKVMIEIEPLTAEEAWDLFQKNARPDLNSPELPEVAKDVVRECKGLPLAIVVLGQALIGESNVTVWNAVLDRLKHSIPEEIEGMEKQVFQSIKFSFDHLRSDEIKLCFLFCCLFPEDCNIDSEDITWYMIGERQIKISETLEKAREQVGLLLNNLKASGLLLEGEDEGSLLKRKDKRSVRMHDIVRDVAIWISKGTDYGFYSKSGMEVKEWPRDIKTEECRRISLMESAIHNFPEVPQFPHLHTLLLSQSKRLERIPDTFLSQMKALEVFDMGLTMISSLPTSVSCLKNLRVLILHGCKALNDLRGLGALKNLEKLNLSLIREINVLPTEVGELANLRHLNLSMTELKIPPNVISRLSNLEELLIEGGFYQWQAQEREDTSCASFAELASLSRLMELFIQVDDKRCLSQDLGQHAFQSLVRFKIIHKFEMTLLDFRRMHPTAYLELVTSTVSDWANLLAGRTAQLCLSSCPGMECLIDIRGVDNPNSIFSNIKELYLTEMEDLGRLCLGTPPDGFFSKLLVLGVFSCHKLINIFSSSFMSTVHQLQHLMVSYCSQLLHVFECNNELGGCEVPMLLPQLETMELRFLPQLTHICESDVPPGSLRELKRLSVRNCESLEHLFSSTLALGLERLETIELQKLPQLTRICEGDVPLGSLRELKFLSVWNCNSLVHLFSPTLALALEHLKDLTIRTCSWMEEIIPSDLQSQSGLFLSLRYLEVGHCDRLATLFSWRQVWNLRMLETLRVFGCDNMVAIIKSEKDNLEEVIVDKTSVLPKLRELYLDDLKISSFDEEGASLFDWPSLKTLYIENCPNLKKLPLRQQSIPKLQRVEGSEDWFRKLEWDDENIKSRLQKLFHPIEWDEERSSSASEDDSFK